MPISQGRRFSCFLIAFVFVAAGVLHFVRPASYVAIMPPYIPFHRAMVLVSGVFEILGGLGILSSFSRRWAGNGLIALLVVVFPANIHMALHPNEIGQLDIAPWSLWLRLPLQLVLIAWVFWATRMPANRTSDVPPLA